jgi:hypothetical protein
MEGVQSENVSGNYINKSKNCHDSYEMTQCEDCTYCYVCDDTFSAYDVNHMGFDKSESNYETIGCSATFDCKFLESCWHNHQIDYCGLCFHSKNLFGCIGLNQAQYCIFNKSYTKHEYETLRDKIIAYMKESGEWGEFFPSELSTFAYNETVAQNYLPLTETEVLQRGYKWRDEENESREAQVEPPYKIPDGIKEIDDSILTQVLHCEATNKPYKIQQTELNFYRKMNLPIPTLHPNERHHRRMGLRNPQELYDRTCSKCKKDIQTTYAPDRPEKILCEECYYKIVN